MASMSTANRMEVPAANVSSRVSTYIPPWARGRKPQALLAGNGPDSYSRHSAPVPCPTLSGPGENVGHRVGATAPMLLLCILTEACWAQGV